MTDTHKKITTYNDCRDKVFFVDCENNNTGNATTLYTSFSMSSSHWKGVWSCNREHVWPQSLGGNNTSGGGADLHHIRPSENLINSTRGNMLYGNVSSGKPVSGNLSNSLGGYSGTYFEPLDNVKGDVARICLYMYVRWNTGWGCSSVTEVFQSVDVLLDWCEQDPVDTWEMGRNEVVGAIQGNRNVFIDYPEYAWQLFGREVPEDMITPSGEASDGNAGSDTCPHSSTEVKNATSATCGKDGYTGDTYCKNCGKKIKAGSTIPATGNHSFSAWKTNSDGSKTRTCSVCGKVETEGVVAPGTSATISFADKANRTVYTSGQQVWKQNGITVTNDKSTSTSNVGDYANPARFYASSKVTVTVPGMTKIVIDCAGVATKNITPWTNSFSDSNATASVSGTTVTITFQTPVDSFTWEKLTAQARANSMTITTGSSGGTVTPPDTEPETTPDTPVVVPPTLAGQIAAANKLANKEYLTYESTITGTITDEPKASDYTQGQFKFTVSDGTNTLLCYYTPVTGGTPAKGDQITVTGKLTAYNGAAQFDSTASATLVKEGGDPVDPPVTEPETTPVDPPVTEPETTPVDPPVTEPETTPVDPPVTEPDTTPANCRHTDVVYRNAVRPTCKEGYSGDVYCKDCGTFLGKGITYPPASAHEYGDATVSEDGKLETRICKACGDRLETALADDQSDLPILWIVIGGCVAVGAVAVAVILISKKRKA